MILHIFKMVGKTSFLSFFNLNYLKQKGFLLIVSLFLVSPPSKAQIIEGDYKFGNISKEELKMSIYSKDSSANAVVLNEFGKVWMDKNKVDLIFEKK